LPEAKPDTMWFGPLVLAAQTPESLIAEVPCSAGNRLPGAVRPVTVLATSRTPRQNGGFAVVQAGGDLIFEVGADEVARVPASQAGVTGECAYQIALENDRWSLTGPGNLRDGDSLTAMPVVTGFFSELDLRQGPSPSASVTTQPHATRTTIRQSALWIVAALAIVIALVLLAFSGAPRGVWAAATSAVRAGLRRLGVVDAGVGAALLGWWVLSPALYDDGWVAVRQRGFEAKRGFSDYYTGIGNNLPNGYWLEWLQHWITQSSETLLVLRLPALICLAVVWLICRWTLARLVDEGDTGRLQHWAMAGGFTAGFMAWGMTLRPEPMTALLVTASLACAVRFHQVPAAGPLALLSLLIPLAITGHHAGVVALAPVLAVAVPLSRWARQQVRSAVALATVAFALLLTLAFIGSDIGQRAEDVRATRAYGGFPETWRDEIQRYDYLSITVFANPLRRGWVALAGLIVLAYVLRSRHGRTALGLPAASLGIALVLLIATPSKWPWHFGTLIGIAAVALATETVRLVHDARRAEGWDVRPFVVVGAALLALVWAFGLREPSNPIDLRALDWTDSTAWLSSATLATGLLLTLAYAAVIAVRVRGERLSAAPWHVATRAALIVALPLITFTVGVLVVDAAKTSGWTLTRQNLQSFRGAAGCGLGDELRVPLLASRRPSSTGASRVPAWLPPIPDSGVRRHLLGNNVTGTPAASPWQTIPKRPFGLFVWGQTNAVALEWGRRTRNGVAERLGSDSVTPVSLPADSGAYLPWVFLTASELPEPPPTADSVRFVVPNEASPRGSYVGVSAPVVYDTTALSQRLERGASLVHPTTHTYFPCARQPEIRNGVVEVPEHIVGDTDQNNPVLVVGTVGPFVGVLDLYRLNRLSLADSANPPDTRIAYSVDKWIPGAVEAPADVTSVRP
jgi:hypothetical protein